MYESGFNSEIEEGEDKSANEGDGENIEAAAKFITDTCGYCSSPQDTSEVVGDCEIYLSPVFLADSHVSDGAIPTPLFVCCCLAREERTLGQYGRFFNTCFSSWNSASE